MEPGNWYILKTEVVSPFRKDGIQVWGRYNDKVLIISDHGNLMIVEEDLKKQRFSVKREYLTGPIPDPRAERARIEAEKKAKEAVSG